MVKSMAIPTSIYAGDTVTFNIPATTDYTSTASWVGTFVLKHRTATDSVSVTGVADGAGGWDFTVSAATTTGLSVDTHWFQFYVTLSGVRHTLQQGELRVLGNIAAGSATFDGRSQAQIDLAAVQAEIRGRMNGGQGASEYTIGNRSLKKIPLADLIALQSQLRADVSREARAARIAKGLDSGRAVFVRFGGL